MGGNGSDGSFTSIFASFEEVVERHGDKVAVEYQDMGVSYEELYSRAVAISGRLPSGRFRSGRVALYFEDRIRAIAAMLAVLRSGHAFVPLDVADPKERIKLILADSQPVAMLTDSENFFTARGLVPKKCRLMNIEDPVFRKRSSGKGMVGPNDLAYLFYTSGSTGQPKGVCQTHANLNYFVRCYCKTLGVTDADRLSLLYSLSFSAANMDIFGGLLHGATVCAYDMRQKGIPALADWLEEKQITVLHAVPTVFRKLTGSMAAGRVFNRIKAIDLGGEAVTAADVELYRGHFKPDCILVNHLAATEASVIAQHIINADKKYDTDILPVGRSHEGLNIWIEKADGSKAAVDEAGRIVIASPHISPGYWQRKDLTAKSFHKHPDKSGWRIFKSEDMGRIDGNGLLHFIGREGTRVKIRGQSVDLAEIEAALRNCSGVKDAAVVAANRGIGMEADTLVAHIVTAKETVMQRNYAGNWLHLCRITCCHQPLPFRKHCL